MGAGHQHAAAPASARVRRVLAWVLAPLALLTVVALAVQWPDREAVLPEGLGLPRTLVRGTVVAVTAQPCVPGGEQEPDDGPTGSDPADTGGGAAECARARIRLTSGPEKGETVTVDVTRGTSLPDVRRGSRVVLAEEPEAPPEARFHVIDVQRGRPLLLLGALFAAAVVALGRWRGVAALAGLVVSFVILTSFALPALLAGASPLPIAITASAAIMFTALYLAHGFSARTSAAVLGTLASLVLTGVLAGVFVAAGRFTGLASEEAVFLGATHASLDLHGLLLAGIIIGSLGVLDDVTVTQASAVWELRAANPALGARDLYRAGLRIGRDHIASTVNTLVLAYAGASLPLLLLFTVAGRSAGDVLTSEIVAQEVVRTLVGSIGLVASVPVTTALAALVVTEGRWGGRGAGGGEPDADDAWIEHLRTTFREGEETT